MWDTFTRPCFLITQIVRSHSFQQTGNFFYYWEHRFRGIKTEAWSTGLAFHLVKAWCEIMAIVDKYIIFKTDFWRFWVFGMFGIVFSSILLFLFRVPRRWHLLFPRPWKKVGSGIHHFLLHKYVHVTSQTYIVVFSTISICY